MRIKYKAISRTLIIILVLALLVVASISLYLTMPKTSSTTTELTSLTTTKTTTSTSYTTSTNPTPTSSSVTTTTTRPSTATIISPTTTPSPKEELYNITNLKDLLNIVKHIKYKYEIENKTEAEHNIFSCTINDGGDEIVSGQATRKIEYEFSSDGESEKCVIWILKQDWDTVVKATLNGQEVESYMLQYFKFHITLLLLPFIYVYNYGSIWAGYYGVGIVQLITTTQITYGETTLKVEKYKFTPNLNYQQSTGILSMDYDVAELMKDLHMITGYKITFKDGSYYLYSVEELTRP
ncbi:MAG: hypothetical protein N3F64_05530 [Nitrososphaeria archaeon]|nr:hypothetical protein [Nitrososphaeria archaeon]